MYEDSRPQSWDNHMILWGWVGGHLYLVRMPCYTLPSGTGMRWFRITYSSKYISHQRVSTLYLIRVQLWCSMAPAFGAVWHLPLLLLTAMCTAGGVNACH